MATATITSDLTLIDNCDATTGWSNVGTADGRSNETSIKKEGTASLGVLLPTTGVGGQVRSISSTDLSNTHIFIWLAAEGDIATRANGGLRVRIGDNTNYGEWYVGGSDTYTGGWQRFAVDTSRPFDATGGTPPSLTAVTSIGATANYNTAPPGDISPLKIDAFHYGSGWTAITGGTVSDPLTWADIVTADATNQEGILQQHPSEGVFILTGLLTIGANTGTLLTVFTDSNEVIMVADQPVADGFNKINVVSNSTNPTELTLGSEIGTAPDSVGSGGGLIQAVGAALARSPLIDSIDADVGDCDFLGLTIIGAEKIQWDQPENRMISCLLNSCGVVELAGSAVLRDSTIDSANLAGVEIAVDPAADTFEDLQIQNCFIGLRVTTAGTYTLRNIKFAGNTYDVENSANGTEVARYNQTNNLMTVRSGDQAVGNGTIIGLGQSFNPSPENENLASVEFFIRKQGAPTGNMRVNLYAHSGTFGTSSIPTGTPLAQSDFIDVASTLNKAFVRVWQVDDSANTFVEETADANSATNADWLLFPATEAVGDYVAFGSREVFDGITFDNANGTAGVAGVVAWEYWDGTAWTALANVSDGTTNFTATAADGQLVHWRRPTDWVARSLDESVETVPLYYIRARVTTVYTTNPVYDQGFVHRLSSFQFPDGFTMLAGGIYVAALEYSGGDASNYLLVAVDTTSPTHGGNAATLTGSTWSAVSGTDCIFRAAGGGRVTLSLIEGSNAAIALNTGWPPGVVDFQTSVVVTINNVIGNSQVIVEVNSTKEQIINDEVVPPSAILYERFEGVGFEEAWTESDSGNGLDPDFVIAGSVIDQLAPSDWQVQCMELVQAASTTRQISHTFGGGGQAVTYFGMEFIVTAESLADAQQNQLWLMVIPATNVIHRGFLRQDSGILNLRVVADHNGTGGTTFDYPIELNRVYRVEVKWDTVADVYEIRLNGETQDSGTLTGAAATDEPTQIIIGGSGGQIAAAATIYADKIGVNDTDWVWQAEGITSISGTFDFPGDTPVTLRVRRSGMGNRYLPYTATANILSSGLSLEAQQILDEFATPVTKFVPNTSA